VRGGRQHGFYDGRPAGYPERNPPFSFEYDFEKYQVTGLAQLFGTHKYLAGDLIAGWVHRWAPQAKSMWDDYRDDQWDDSRRNTTERWIGNLAWHGVFLAAGSLLLQLPISGRSWTRDAPWLEWLAEGLLSREDGRWLADDVTLEPLDLRKPLTTDNRPVPRLPRELIPHFTLGAEPGSIVVEASWDTSDGADMTISSGFVPRAQATAAAMSVALATHHDVWVPRADEIEQHWDDKHGPWRGWLTLDETRREGGLDAKDPYAAAAARYNTRPTDDVVDKSGLTPELPFARRWRTQDGRVLIDGVVWGRRRGRGDHEQVIEGRRLTADVAWLSDLCRQRNQALVLVVQARRYMPERSGDAAFPSIWLVATLDRDGALRPLLRIPPSVRKAVSALGRDRQREFHDRIEAIKGALQASAANPKLSPR
jgi:hypothetical protein